MTGLSARRFGLSERGLVQVGYHADLVLFDADKVRDTATFAEPRQAADGIDAVWVNGVLSYLDGAVTGLRAGHFVARGEGSRLDALGHF
jgi:N-acyl-D-aspartate/D-glutamate deacylase